jgi:hypothetical protein
VGGRCEERGLCASHPPRFLATLGMTRVRPASRQPPAASPLCHNPFVRPEWKARVAIGAAFVAAAFLFLAPGYIRPDSVAVFSYLRSAVFDGDFSFFNEWASAGMVRSGVTLFAEVTPAGALANHWWIGTSILSAPAYLAARLLGGAPDGFSALFGMTLAMMNVAFALFAMLIAWSLLCGAGNPAGARRRDPRRHTEAVLGIVAVVLGTPFFWYTFIFPLGTHMAGALATALVFVALFRNEKSSGLAVGLATGLAIIVRLQHFVIIPAVIYVAWRQRREIGWWLAAIAGGALAIACQAVAWLAIYGTPLGPLTRGATLAGTTWMPFRNIALGSVLFSSYHGVLWWSPVIFLAILGWISAMRSFDARRSTIAVTSLLMFAGEWIANGTFDRYFWGGMSFGPRRFVDLAVPIALGIAWFGETISSRIASAIVIALTLWSVALMAAAQAHTLSLARYVSGADIVHAVTAPDTWQRLTAIQWHSPVTNGMVLKQAVIALAIVGVLALIAAMLRGRVAVLASTLGMAIALVIVILISARTPSAARASAQRLHIDVAASSRIGPLLDERGLLIDELAWKRARGDGDGAMETIGELRQIDAVLNSFAATPRSSSASPSRSGAAPSSPAPAPR